MRAQLQQDAANQPVERDERPSVCSTCRRDLRWGHFGHGSLPLDPEPHIDGRVMIHPTPGEDGQHVARFVSRDEVEILSEHGVPLYRWHGESCPASRRPWWWNADRHSTGMAPL
jgi:hypothetical protein